jgi:GNAT superfamily N-acetyltransferase
MFPPDGPTGDPAQEKLFGVPAGYGQRLGPGQADSLQALLEDCADLFQLVFDAPPSASAARELFAQLPEGKGYEDKQVIGLHATGGRLVGVLDAVRDHPAPDDWWLGLLLLEPQERNCGRGGAWYRAFEEWAAQQGVRQVRLGVVEQNARGLRFWQRMGFEVQERRPPQRMGRKESVTLVMRRLLAA